MKFVGKHQLQILAIAAIAAIAVFCHACKNDISVVQSLTSKEKSPDEKSTQLHLYSTENGQTKYELFFEEIDHYTQPEKYYLSTKPFQVDVFDEEGNRTLTLTADFGINYEVKRMMIAKRNVVIHNWNTGDVIETEQLIWDMNTHRVYSNTQIKQTKKDGSVYIGDGFTSDEKMESYMVTNPVIIYYTKEED